MVFYPSTAEIEVHDDHYNTAFHGILDVRVLGHNSGPISEKGGNRGSSNSFLHTHEVLPTLLVQLGWFVKRRRPICVQPSRPSTSMDYSIGYVCTQHVDLPVCSITDHPGEQVLSCARLAFCPLFSRRCVSQKSSQRFLVAFSSVRFYYMFFSPTAIYICRPNRVWSYPRVHNTRLSTRIPSLP